MKRNGQITAFYFETLLLIVVFLAIILVLTQVFGLARQQTAAARPRNRIQNFRLQSRVAYFVTLAAKEVFPPDE